MLIQFSVENFKSFDALTTFSLRATADSRLPHHVVENEKGRAGAHLGVLRAAAIYGANAAGKSNLVLAMSFAQRLILSGTRGEERIAVQPFKLRSGEAAPSRFEFIFRHDGVLYSYGFAASTRRVHQEWLFATAKTKETLMFERITDESNETKVKFGAALRRSAGSNFLDFIAQGTRANQLLFAECYENDVDEIKPVREWFGNVLRVLRADSEWEPWPLAMRFDVGMKQFAGDFLRNSGTGIERVEGEEMPLTPQSMYNFPSMDWETLLTNVELLEEREAVVLEDVAKRRSLVMRGKNGQPCLIHFVTVHRDATGKEVRFAMEEESEGTQRLFHLVPDLQFLKRRPRVLVIDELDRRLHTLLARLFVQSALDCRDDDPHGQLIFTTHDTNLLDLDLLRRDEIWFTEKDRNGATHLASLAEWKVRPDLEIEKGYLNGRFGAIPFFGDVSKLQCEAEKKPEVTIASTKATRRKASAARSAARETKTEKAARLRAAAV